MNESGTSLGKSEFSTPLDSGTRGDSAILLSLAAGLIAPLVAPFCAVMAARDLPEYSHISGTYSDLAAQGQAAPELMSAGLLVTGLLVIANGFGLGRVLPRRGGLIRLAMVIAGAAIAMTGLAQDYPRGRGGTYNPEAWVHNAAVLVAILAIVTGLIIFAGAVARQPGWNWLVPVTIVCLIGVFISGAVLQFGQPTVDGLAERVLTTFAFVWVAAASLTGLQTILSPRPVVEFDSRSSRQEPA